MKRLSFILAAVLFVCPMIAAQTGNNAILLSNVIQIHKHIEGSSISYTGGVFTIPYGKWAKAAELTPGAAGGVLKVHLVGDGATTYYSMPMDLNSIRGVLFDKVIQSGTTVNLNYVNIFLVE
jgi:hypothetical protein